MPPIDLSRLQTESVNSQSSNIDQLSSLDVCEIINNEDATVSGAVKAVLPAISAAVDALASRVRHGGRVIYVGAGTSGRLGVLDASEIPPTFSAPYGQFVALMAGGDAAIRRAQEGAEDDRSAAESDLRPLELNGDRDSLIGIAASGQTPYVLGCLAYAKRIGCITIGVTCCAPSAMSESGLVDYMIAPITGPEVVTGSTRMKAGTATKLVLNTMSTAVMIKAGKTFGNMRSRNIIRTLSKSLAPDSDAEIDALTERCGGSVKLALGVIHLGTNVEEARRQLDAAGGKLSLAIERSRTSSRVKHIEYVDTSDLVLCVDGGGSKCAAVVVDSIGRTGRAQAGPCNVTSIDIRTAMSTISHAATKALEDYAQQTNLVIRQDSSPSFGAVWIGLAGYDRVQLQPSIHASLSKIFHQPVGPKLRVSADIDLLAAPLMLEPTCRSAIVLVAGTGSIATRYTCQASGIPVRIARSGGWGRLLGDDGSGFDLGRRAIRQTLSRLDSRDGSALGALHDGVLRKCGIAASAYDKGSTSALLLNAILAPTSLVTSNDHTSSSNPHQRIAELARTVLGLASSDDDARVIIWAGAASLADLMVPLLGTGVEDTALILSGGLMQSQVYREQVLAKVREAGVTFGTVRVVEQPAVLGAQSLRRQMMDEQRDTSGPRAKL